MVIADRRINFEKGAFKFIYDITPRLIQHTGGDHDIVIHIHNQTVQLKTAAAETSQLLADHGFIGGMILCFFHREGRDDLGRMTEAVFGSDRKFFPIFGDDFKIKKNIAV